jgi:hypothetical protein
VSDGSGLYFRPITTEGLLPLKKPENELGLLFAKYASML